jgi:hypothetical protein
MWNCAPAQEVGHGRSSVCRSPPGRRRAGSRDLAPAQHPSAGPGERFHPGFDQFADDDVIALLGHRMPTEDERTLVEPDHYRAR